MKLIPLLGIITLVAAASLRAQTTVDPRKYDHMNPENRRVAEDSDRAFAAAQARNRQIEIDQKLKDQQSQLKDQQSQIDALKNKAR